MDFPPQFNKQIAEELQHAGGEPREGSPSTWTSATSSSPPGDW